MVKWQDENPNLCPDIYSYGLDFGGNHVNDIWTQFVSSYLHGWFKRQPLLITKIYIHNVWLKGNTYFPGEFGNHAVVSCWELWGTTYIILSKVLSVIQGILTFWKPFGANSVFSVTKIFPYNGALHHCIKSFNWKNKDNDVVSCLDSSESRSQSTWNL